MACQVLRGQAMFKNLNKMQNGSLWECIVGGRWVDNNTYQSKPGPAKGEIVTECGRIAEEFLVFEEYPPIENGEAEGYHIDFFRKLQDPLEVNLEQLISEPITV